MCKKNESLEILMNISNQLTQCLEKNSHSIFKGDLHKNRINVKSKSTIWNKIINDYYDIISLEYMKDKRKTNMYTKISYNHFGEGRNAGIISVKKKVIEDPNMDDLFDLLHEIGHITTNKLGQHSCEEEYDATVWALQNRHKYGVYLSDARFDGYQDYIYEHREKNITEFGDINIPTKRKLSLKKYK